MGLFVIDQFQVIAFALVFLRCLAFFMSWPIFSSANLPVQLKVLLALLMGFVCFALIPREAYPQIEHYQGLIALAVKEMAIGFAMGFLCNLIFHAVSVAGELISMAMGLSSAQMFNPSMGIQQSSLNQLYFFLAAFLFLSVKGHHYFLTGLVQSFELVPLTVLLPRLAPMGEFSLLGQRILEVGLLLSAPVLVSILVINISLGIVGRAVPQINVLITSLPVNALLGLGMLLVMLPFFLDAVRADIDEFAGVMFSFLKVF